MQVIGKALVLGLGGGYTGLHYNLCFITYICVAYNILYVSVNFVFKVKSNQRCCEGWLQACSLTTGVGRIDLMESRNKMRV